MDRTERRLNDFEKMVIAGSKDILTVKDVSILSGLSRNHIYQLIHKKLIPHYKSAGGKMVYFRKEDVDKYLCAVRVPTLNEIAIQENLVMSGKEARS